MSHFHQTSNHHQSFYLFLILEFFHWQETSITIVCAEYFFNENNGFKIRTTNFIHYISMNIYYFRIWMMNPNVKYCYFRPVIEFFCYCFFFNSHFEKLTFHLPFMQSARLQILETNRVMALCIKKKMFILSTEFIRIMEVLFREKGKYTNNCTQIEKTAQIQFYCVSLCIWRGFVF